MQSVPLRTLRTSFSALKKHARTQYRIAWTDNHRLEASIQCMLVNVDPLFCTPLSHFSRFPPPRPTNTSRCILPLGMVAANMEVEAPGAECLEAFSAPDCVTLLTKIENGTLPLTVSRALVPCVASFRFSRGKTVTFTLGAFVSRNHEVPESMRIDD